nr:hypothetical protein Iba_chr06aCG8850 [Ipomoea batatas]
MALVVAMAGGASCSLLLRSAAFIGGGCGDWGERRSSESGGVEGKKQSESFWAVACGIWQEEATGCVYEMQVFLGCGLWVVFNKEICKCCSVVRSGILQVLRTEVLDVAMNANLHLEHGSSEYNLEKKETAFRFD